MDILKAEIAKKRKLLEEKELLVNFQYLFFKNCLNILLLQGSQKKYFKRGELIAKEQQEYLRKYSKENEIKDHKEKESLGNATDNVILYYQIITFNLRINNKDEGYHISGVRIHEVYLFILSQVCVPRFVLN